MTKSKVMAMEIETEPLAGKKSQPQIPQMRPVGFFENFYQLIIAYALYYKSITATVFVFSFIVLVVLMLQFIAVISTKSHIALTSITHDLTSTNKYTQYDALLKNVDHWCLLGGNEDCTCDDPTIPLSAFGERNWTHTFKRNVKMVQNASQNDLDVVFLGDQNIEAWHGGFHGIKIPSLKKVSDEFNSKFNSETSLKGVPLGIGGDVIANLYWRLIHGEMTEGDPKVWWISIGGNDLANGHCSEEIVLLGILRLAEFISERNPETKVVINSIIPSHKEIKEKRQLKPFDLWSSIQVVNNELKKFCDNHPQRFHFFDATEIFFTRKPKSVEQLIAEMKANGGKKLRNTAPPLKSNLILPNGKIKPAGHKAWMEKAEKELREVIIEEIYIPQYDQGIMDEESEEYYFDTHFFTDDGMSGHVMVDDWV